MSHDTPGMIFILAFWGMGIVLVGLGVRVVLRWRGASKGGVIADSDTESRLRALEESTMLTGELDAQARHIAELEERLDFAERLLAQRNTAELPMHRTPV